MSQAKLDESFTTSTSKLHLDGYDIKATKDRKKYSPV